VNLALGYRLQTEVEPVGRAGPAPDTVAK
jgi:hypothetical protein